MGAERFYATLWFFFFGTLTLLLASICIMKISGHKETFGKIFWPIETIIILLCGGNVLHSMFIKAFPF